MNATPYMFPIPRLADGIPTRGVGNLTSSKGMFVNGRAERSRHYRVGESSQRVLDICQVYGD